jgi:hypothetical protein
MKATYSQARSRMQPLAKKSSVVDLKVVVTWTYSVGVC